MSDLTDEQEEYIKFTKLTDTKLIACAGSGKTRCIILRMEHIIKLNILTADNILMLTFSRFTRDDFLNKIKKYKIKNIPPSCVRTIDSFAKYLIDDENNIDVSLLSFKFMKYLQDLDIETIRRNDKLNKIKMVFIDEAQDLNEVQYNIFLLLKNKLGIIINLIGDPNQNIYQFRDSSDKYLISFKTTNVFELTKNFRSYYGIINFSKYIRPNNELDVSCVLGESKLKPQFVFHQTDKDLEEGLLKILYMSLARKVDLSDIAILSPTRGRMRSYGKSNGLCLVSNILYKAGIKFKQFYEEATDEISTHSNYVPEKGYVNLLTYMGSKGLEWKYVILIDADLCLINKRYFDTEKHNNDRYLLYVACSRAIKNVVIFSHYKVTKGFFDFRLNPWFSVIPKENYIINELSYNFRFCEFKPSDTELYEKKITKIIDNFKDIDLDYLADICDYENSKVERVKFGKDFSKEDVSNVFLGKYIEKLFHVYYDIINKKPKLRYHDIENIIDQKNIIYNVPFIVTEWFFMNKNKLTWKKFDEEKNKLDKIIVDFVNKRFNREVEISQHTIINDSYFQVLILSDRENIKNDYDEYLKNSDFVKIRYYLFYVQVLIYSLETQHYFHVKNKGDKFKYILTEYSELFDTMIEYVKKMEIKIVNHNEVVTNFNLIGEIDAIDENNNIWELKCVSDITLKHYLQVLMYNIMYNSDKEKFKLNFINFLTSEEIYIDVKISKSKIKNIIDKFVMSSNKNK
jgi:hypothetical protein